MSAPSKPGRGRGRPKREYRIRVRGERWEIPDYDKLARALLEHAAMQERERHEPTAAPKSQPSADATTEDEEGSAS
jgi:predicted ArsR family transcriptional regulator